MSYANFLNADPEYLKAVDGLKPKSGQHQTQIDFEPVRFSDRHYVYCLIYELCIFQNT